MKARWYPGRKSILTILAALLFVGQSVIVANEATSIELSEPALIKRLNQATGEPVNISYHRETGKVRFIGTSPQHAIAQPAMLSAGASPQEAARGFLSNYGTLFGLQDQASELTIMKERVLADGRAFVRFQQVYKGIPVVGGELIVQTNAARDVISANGEVLPDLDLDVTPSITAAAARQSALAKVAKDYGLSVAELTTTVPELWIYDPALMGGPGLRFSALVWRIEVTPLELRPIDEFVLVDAQLGAIALHFNQIDTVLNRETYDANNTTTLPGTLVCNEAAVCSMPGITDTHAIAAHTYAGDTYNFYMAEHGRDSLDNAGMTLISTVHYSVTYKNAFWSGSQMVYGDGFGFPLADDVVGHELTHGVTNSESNLFYYFQSGAINESFSDVWGEFVDQTNGAGTDTPAVKWQMGEDITGLGAIRNMQDPTLHNQPDRMSSGNYVCVQANWLGGVGDAGGVHSNSGVNNKAVYLMTDGDTFNGKTVTGLGISKVADLYYEVQTNTLTSAADYADLYDALIQASKSLGYSASDQQEVMDALDAVEMNQTPTSCGPPEAPICDVGPPINDLFFDDIESGGGNWVSGIIVTGTVPVNWFVPQTTATFGFAGSYATSGVGNIWGFSQGSPFGSTSDTFLAMNSDVVVTTTTYMHFNHAFGFESDASAAIRYDGGIVEYSTNGGSTWMDAGSLFTHNGYNGTLEATNPLTSTSSTAFSADSGGYRSSRLDLSSLSGQNVRFRFRIGTDSGTYDYGWFIDDVRIYNCSPYIFFLPVIMKP